MISAAVIVFREVLEASIVISIVLAATRGLHGRMRWVGAGLLAGLAGAAAVAAFAQALASLLAGAGQEFFNASVLFLAVAMLGWHNVWMSRHGRAMAAQIGDVSRAVRRGAKPVAVVAAVVGLAVLREGAEVVLFLLGIAAAEGGRGMLAGSVLGAAAAALLGVALYAGLLRIPSRWLFGVTAWLILLLAAGMAAQGAMFLAQAGWLPPLGESLWDTSHILAQNSPLGLLLHVLLGYVERPDGVQVLFYGATLAMIGGAMLLWGREAKSSQDGLAFPGD
jgi:high-affinity iron transporter